MKNVNDPECGAAIEFVIEPSSETADLLDMLERSGMRRLNCARCGCEMLTRGASNECPPCRKKASDCSAQLPLRSTTN
jgi:hypothetical protein